MSKQIPSRIGSAPLARPSSDALQQRLRPGEPFRSTMAPKTGTGSYPSRPPAPLAPPCSSRLNTTTAPETAAPAGSGRASAPAPPAPAPKDFLQSYFPEDCVYAVPQFIKLSHCQGPLAEAIMNHAVLVWKSMPENQNTLDESNSLRNTLFNDEKSSLPSKVMQDRKLHNQVLGILGKVTESNLLEMQRELTDLPIRQSTEEEIHDVINVIFNKSTRPEDNRFTPLYVKLFKHLINTIGEHEPAGQMIRKALVHQCRDTFLSASHNAKALEMEMAKVSKEDAEMLRLQFEGKQKANVYFLGLMFSAGLVVEVVVRAVLDSLLYAEGRRRNIPSENNVTQFMNLLGTCGPHVSSGFYVDPLQRYRASLEEISRSYPKIRIRFLTQNFLETMDNNWIPLHGRDAKPRAAQEAAGRVVPPPAPLPEPKVKIPDMEEFWKVMDDFFATSVVDEAVTMIDTIGSHEIVTTYCAKWIGRYITTYKYTQERTRLGDLFEVLAKRNAITPEIAQGALIAHLKQAIKEELFADQPRYFTHWAAVIRNGRSIFPPSLHTQFLDMLVRHHAQPETIMQMIADVQKACEENSKGEQRDYHPMDRLRVLQALLRYTPPLDDCEALSEEEGIITAVNSRKLDVEVELFDAMCESYDDSHADAIQCVHEALKQSHTNVYPLISAYFTFVRFEVDALCTTYKDVLKKLTTVRPVVSLLEEVYVQWRALECPEVYYFQFAKRLQQSFTKTDSVEKLNLRLRGEYNAPSSFLTSLEKYLK